MTTENEWHRPKKPYTVVPERTSNTNSWSAEKPAYNGPKKAFKSPKPVVIPAKNNANNKILHVAMRENSTVKIFVNNLLCSEKDLPAVYEGKITSFDDFTIALETFNGYFLINKSAIAVAEIITNETR